MSAAEWALGAGLTVRLVLLLTRDTIAEPLRTWLNDCSARWVDGWRGGLVWWAARVVGCPWCASPYVAGLVLVVRPVPGWWVAATVGCWSLAAGLVGEVLMRGDP